MLSCSSSIFQVTSGSCELHTHQQTKIPKMKVQVHVKHSIAAVLSLVLCYSIVLKQYWVKYRILMVNLLGQYWFVLLFFHIYMAIGCKHTESLKVLCIMIILQLNVCVERFGLVLVKYLDSRSDCSCVICNLLGMEFNLWFVVCNWRI